MRKHYAPVSQATGIRKRTAAQVGEVLAENVVFNGAILVRPIEGRDLVAAIFAHTTFLRWARTMDGRKFESWRLSWATTRGRSLERTIALRPYPALNLFRGAMYASLNDKLPPDVWDYPTT